MRWWWNRKLPEFVEAYLDATPRKFDSTLPVGEVKFVVIDAETSGMRIGRDRVLSLAAQPVSGGRMDLRKMQSWVLFQAVPLQTDSVSVHGILPRETAQGTPEADVLPKLLACLSGSIIVGHHIGFDVAMINDMLKRHHHTTLRNPILDTSHLAMHALDAFARTGYPGQRDPGLDEVCAQVGIEPVERHTAEGDTFTTATLLLTLLAHLGRRRKKDLVVKDLPLSS